MSQHSPEPQQPKSMPFWKVVISVVQAGFGVQSNRNRERDFTEGKFLPFVAAAVIFTVIFTLTLVLIVRMVLPD